VRLWTQLLAIGHHLQGLQAILMRSMQSLMLRLAKLLLLGVRRPERKKEVMSFEAYNE
jgi:hypothetical protein